MADHDVVEMQIPNSSTYVSVVRNAVGAIARHMDFKSGDVEDLKLAVGEACANAVRHGCPVDGAACTVRVLCHVTNSGLEIEIYNHVNHGDNAPAICTNPDLSREGGLGLFLIRKLMDEVDLNWEDGWATVRMVKRLRRA